MKKGQRSIKVSLKFEPDRQSNSLESEAYEQLYPEQKRAITEHVNSSKSEKTQSQVKESKA